MAFFIPANLLHEAVQALSSCGASRNMFAYLILRRLMVTNTTDNGTIVLAGKQCRPVIDEAALIGCGDNRYYNPFDQKHQIMSDRWWSNGPTDNLKNWGSRTSLLRRVQGAKSVTVEVSPYDSSEIKRFLEIGEEKARIEDVALWWFRHIDLSEYAKNNSLRLDKLVDVFCQRLHLEDQQVQDLFLPCERDGFICGSPVEADPIDYIIGLKESADSGQAMDTASQLPHPWNLIFFGAPGTGKSHQLNELAEENFDEDCIRRVTFYPDYTYAQFVGCFKPISDEVPDDEGGNKTVITYRFVFGPFLETYLDAVKHPDRNYLLIIEEINRANPAAVFGDVFQLLDRKKGVSEYAVSTPEEMRRQLENELDGYAYDTSYLAIPANMYLWATMNSADQGVFPMDTAFKRRWDFRYIGIDDGEDADIDGERLNEKVVTSGGRKVYWNELRKAINRLMIEDCRLNEDKLLGPFFLSPDSLTEERFGRAFKDKVLLYLYEDAGKMKRKDLFWDYPVTYSQVCAKFDADGEGVFGRGFDERSIWADGEGETDDGTIPSEG